mmetsp:Transcript_59684/g.129264  ORF Transcript_59684/g.129264 Transcript_59684/m.129264 type:complete len:278 (-) Transcript_59684:19-852(-)
MLASARPSSGCRRLVGFELSRKRSCAPDARRALRAAAAALLDGPGGDTALPGCPSKVFLVWRSFESRINRWKTGVPEEGDLGLRLGEPGAETTPIRSPRSRDCTGGVVQVLEFLSGDRNVLLALPSRRPGESWASYLVLGDIGGGDASSWVRRRGRAESSKTNGECVSSTSRHARASCPKRAEEATPSCPSGLLPQACAATPPPATSAGPSRLPWEGSNGCDLCGGACCAHWVAAEAETPGGPAMDPRRRQSCPVHLNDEGCPQGGAMEKATRAQRL